MICDPQPREKLVHLPTPLEAAPRLSQALGVEVLVKREDLAGLCVGGNKARLLEFALGAVVADGADTLIASAAAQSNKLRDIAAAAARCGLRAVLLVPADEAHLERQGNRLLFDLLGAEVRTLPPGIDADAVLAAQQDVAAEIRRDGGHPVILDRHLDYGVHATLGYVDAAEELAGQLRERGIESGHVYVTAGAGMTTAGLALGFKHLGVSMRVTGVCVARPAAQLGVEVRGYAQRAATALGIATTLDDDDLELVDDYLAPGYGIVTRQVRETIRTVARLHGMVIDPVYNAKTAHALIDRSRRGLVSAGETVVLVNTGGSPGIYAHHAELLGTGGPDRDGALSVFPRGMDA